MKHNSNFSSKYEHGKQLICISVSHSLIAPMCIPFNPPTSQCIYLLCIQCSFVFNCTQSLYACCPYNFLKKWCVCDKIIVLPHAPIYYICFRHDIKKVNLSIYISICFSCTFNQIIDKVWKSFIKTNEYFHTSRQHYQT